MFSLRLRCRSEQVDELVAKLWDAATTGISETLNGDEVNLLAGFSQEADRASLLREFSAFRPAIVEDNQDWVAAVEQSWPVHQIGSRLFLAPMWSEVATPPGRVRVIHNPGLASGTGEHPCTQLALAALEMSIGEHSAVLDVGTGSGLLAIAALSLGAGQALGIDTDYEALSVARENAALNKISLPLVCGSADSLRDGSADVSVANISGTVLMNILSELLRVTRPGGMLVLSGFRTDEQSAFLQIFPEAFITELDGWVCLRTYV